MKKGFTIIELLVIISITGLISSVALANLQSSKDKAKIAASQIFRSNVNSALGDTMLASWNFNEGIQGNPINAVPDSSGAGLEGTVVIPPGGTATYVEGINNIGTSALLMGGAHITGGGIRSSGGNSVSVTAWINPIQSTTNVRNIFSVNLGVCRSFRMGINSAQLMVGNDTDRVTGGNVEQDGFGGGGYDSRISPENLLAAPGVPVILNASGITNNRWQLIAVSFDSSGEVRTYIDGVNAVNIGGLPTSDCQPAELATWSIGGIPPGSGPEYTYFTGMVDDITVYNGSLSPGFISELYKSGVEKYSLATHQPL